jgi:hypothetical protein
MLQQDEHHFQHMSPTYYPSWPSPHIHWSATRPRNQPPTSKTQERSGTQNLSLTDPHRSGREHHWSDRSLLVKLGDLHRKALHWSGRYNTSVRPVQANRPTELQNTKQAYRAPKRPKLETAATRDNSELTHMFTQEKTQQGLHRSDRCGLGFSG